MFIEECGLTLIVEKDKGSEGQSGLGHLPKLLMQHAWQSDTQAFR